MIKHIVENHTQATSTVISRFICKVCNVEVHGDTTKNNHMCRKPQWSCTWCKHEFYSSEARKNHICEKHQFKTVDEQLRARKRSQTECINGTGCWRAARNKCWFKHSQPLNSLSQQGQGQQGQGQQGQAHQRQGLQEQGQPGQGHQGQVQQLQHGSWQQGQPGQGHQGQLRQGQSVGGARPQLYCRFQERCFKGEACKFKHFQVGFHQTNQPQNQQ